MEEIISDIGSTPSLEPVTDDNILELFNSASSATTLQQSEDQQQQQQDLSHDPTTEAERDKRPAKIHSCGFCGAVYPSYRELVEHRASHGGSRPYECHVCDKRFTQKAHLIIHRRTHTGEKPYSCHICHKRFSQTSHLNSHKRVHTGEKPYFCSLCNMGFCRRQRLEVHLQQHAKDMQQGYAAQNPEAQELLQQSMSVQKTLQQQQQQPALSSEAAKDFLMSIGLGNVMQEAGRSGMVGEGGDSSSTSKGISAQSQMSVFPGFSMEEDGGAENEELDENDHPDGEDRESRSPTPTSSQSQRSPTPTSAKSRRKPAFVRKLGFGQTEKEENRGEEVVPTIKAEENGADDASKADLSDHAAAVRAMIHMATGSDYPNTEDLMNNLSVLNNTNPVSSQPGSSSFPASSASSHHNNHRNSLSLSKPFPTNRPLPPPPAMLSSLIRTNTRVSLVDFTAEDLLRHLMSRDDVYRCDFCCVIFHDAAMYHLHRSMHDKMDIRCCNLCGLLLTDKYDFTAHFLSQHK